MEGSRDEEPQQARPQQLPFHPCQHKTGEPRGYAPPRNGAQRASSQKGRGWMPIAPKNSLKMIKKKPKHLLHAEPTCSLPANPSASERARTGHRAAGNSWCSFSWECSRQEPFQRMTKTDSWDFLFPPRSPVLHSQCHGLVKTTHLLILFKEKPQAFRGPPRRYLTVVLPLSSAPRMLL